MNEIIDLLQSLMQQAASLSDELSDEEMSQILKIFQDTIEVIGSASNQVTEIEVPDNAKLLWHLSGGQPNAFVSYLREFPDPTLRQLLANPEQLAETIQNLQQNNPVDMTGSADGLPRADLNSSNVYGFRFDPNTKKMKVRFQSGSVYEYDGIPDLIFNLFSHGNAEARTSGKNKYGRWWRGKNPSLGAALNQYIKAGGYNYRRLK